MVASNREIMANFSEVSHSASFLLKFWSGAFEMHKHLFIHIFQMLIYLIHVLSQIIVN